MIFLHPYLNINPKDITRIDLVLENCDVIDLTLDDISNFKIKSLCTMKNHKDNNSIESYLSDNIEITIINDFFRFPFDKYFDEYGGPFDYRVPHKIYERLSTHQDIAYIDIKTRTGTTRIYTVYFPAGKYLGAENLNQKSDILNGKLIITINNKNRKELVS